MQIIWNLLWTKWLQTNLMNIISCSKVIYPVLPSARLPPTDFTLIIHPNLPLFYPYLVASYRVRDTPVNLPLLLLSYWKKEGDDFRVRVVAKASSTIYNLRILSKVKNHIFKTDKKMKICFRQNSKIVNLIHLILLKMAVWRLFSMRSRLEKRKLSQQF